MTCRTAVGHPTENHFGRGHVVRVTVSGDLRHGHCCASDLDRICWHSPHQQLRGFLITSEAAVVAAHTTGAGDFGRVDPGNSWSQSPPSPDTVKKGFSFQFCTTCAKTGSFVGVSQAESRGSAGVGSLDPFLDGPVLTGGLH